MFMMRHALVLSSFALALAACGNAGMSGKSAGGNVRAGLSVRLAADQRTSGNQVTNMESIFVSVTGVAAHAAGGGWVTVSESPVVVDLLRLQDSAEELGFAHLPEGKITQIRLYVADDGLSHAVTKDGDDRVLRVPSGFQTGVKLKGPFELGECENGTVLAVMDIEKSILIHGRGNHDDWTLRPTVHRTDYEAIPADICEPTGPAEGEGEGAEGEGEGAEGEGEDGDCPPGTEGCSYTDGGEDGDGTGTDGEGDGTGTDDGTGTGGEDGGTGTGTDGGTDGTGGEDTGTGTDPGDECAPILVEGVGLMNPCTGEAI
jgi:Domain of unknown function (DUF4382)